jgi:hypothetical protein
MAQKNPPSPQPDRRLVLESLQPGEDPPPIRIDVLDEKGERIHTAQVKEDGGYDIPDGVRKRAHRVVLGPADPGPEEAEEVRFSYRASTFFELEKAGHINVGRGVWTGWRVALRCVSGSVRRCRPAPWWFRQLEVLAAERPVANMSTGSLPGVRPMPRTADNLASSLGLRDLQGDASDLPAVQRLAGLSPGDLLTPVRTIPELVAWPWRCAPVCDARVEVYRRTCCCKPWIVWDPRLPELENWLEDLIPRPPLPDPFPDPIPGPFPGAGPGPLPGPDPGPRPGTRSAAAATSESEDVDLVDAAAGPPAAVTMPSAFVLDGALDEARLNAARDLAAIRGLPAAQVAEYIRARPYLVCGRFECSAPVKVGEGTLNPQGRFNICWLDFRRPLSANCSDRYAYVVRQRFGPFWITIYDGRSANQWYSLADSPTLTSYHALARTCRTNPGGAFVWLNFVGDTGAWDLHTPDAVSAVGVGPVGYNSGLVSPNGATGLYANRNWGGILRLNLMIAEGMKALGARYYRISVIRAGPGGAPTGTRHTVDAPVSWKKSVPDGGGGVTVVPVSLGPQTVAGRNGLYAIPFDSDGDWDDGQFHALLDTRDERWNHPHHRHLVTVEVFDDSGRRLRPQGTPATGLGGPEVQAAFTFRRRYQDLGPTAEVPFGALTHMFWWDNRDIFGRILDLRRNGLVFNEECLFLTGTPTSSFGIGYRAFHPNQLFQLYHNVRWRRGLGSAAGHTGYLEYQNTANVGVPPAAPGASATNTFQQMLRTDLVPSRTKCAFTVFLNVWNKRTDGGNLSFPHQQDTAAFVLEIGASGP